MDTDRPDSPSYYPAFLKLRGRQAVVVGGGEVALRKVEGLLSAGAAVTLIAPELHPELEELALEGAIQVLRRPYQPGDLAPALVAVAATSDPLVNEQVAAEADARRVLLNVVDVPDASTFIVPSVIRRDELTLAISTGGMSPALAKRIREKLEETLVPEYGAFLRVLGGLRTRVRKELPLPEQRELFWTEVVASDAFELFRSRGELVARSRIAEILQRVREGEP